MFTTNKISSGSSVIPRREFLRRSALAPFVLGYGFSLSGKLLAEFANPALEGIYKFNIGDIECTAISDGLFHYEAHLMFANPTKDELNSILAQYRLDPESVPSPYTCLAVRSGNEWILIDTGIGPISPDLGKLLPRLHEAEIDPADISTVIITHGHPDHIGGNTDEDGNVNFPNARFVMWKNEWDFWTSETELAKLPDLFSDIARKNLPPIKDRVELLERESEIHPGIHVISAAGHTPGHIVVHISSGDEILHILGDAVLHPINFEKPGWYSEFDMDPGHAVRTRRRLLERAVSEEATLQCFHFDPFPGIGNAVEYRDAWRWNAMEV